MIYECAFDFTICKPKKSQFIGKSGIIELTTNGELSPEMIEDLKKDKQLERDICWHLNTVLKQQNVFMIKVTGLTPVVG